MKKIFIYGLLLCTTALGFTSCNDDEDQLSDTRVTYFVNLDIQGDEITVAPLGQPYTDAGCKADLNGEDYTSQIKTTGSADPNTPGAYNITYSAVNPDGFPASASRTVIVYNTDNVNAEADLSGSWTVDAAQSNRLYNGNTAKYKGNFKIKLTKLADGLYLVSDFLGGWYDQGAGYGSSYAMGGYLTITKDNKLECVSSLIPGWGDSLTGFSGTYNPATNNITWDAVYVSGMTFHTVLNQ